SATAVSSTRSSASSSTSKSNTSRVRERTPEQFCGEGGIRTRGTKAFTASRSATNPSATGRIIHVERAHPVLPHTQEPDAGFGHWRFRGAARAQPFAAHRARSEGQLLRALKAAKPRRGRTRVNEA